MNLSIIGAGKRRNGIGGYIAKYFHENGARVTGVLGTTQESSRRTAATLRECGIEAHSYTDFRQMVDRESPDLVVIASPSSTHYDYLAKCVDSSLHVFCEKPFVSWETEDAATGVERMLTKAKDKGLTVAMNSQWPFSVPYYEQLCGRIQAEESHRFFMRLAPSCTGREMVPESVPHALSLLYSVFGPGTVREVSFESVKERELSLRFRYVGRTTGCDIHIELATQEIQPRDFSYGFNGKIVCREIELSDYGIFFCYENRKIRISDPLELSVRNVIEAVEKKSPPLVGDSHILNNVSGLRAVYDGYCRQVEGRVWKN